MENSNSNTPSNQNNNFSSWENSQLFTGLSKDQLQNLSYHLINKSYSSGDFIIKEGGFGDAIFFIEKGSVDIFKDNVKLAENHAGDYFGGMALMENTSRSADVIATTPLQVKVLTINQLKAIQSDDIFIRVLTNHLIKQQEVIREKNRSLILATKNKLEEAELHIQKTRQYPRLIIFLLFTILVLVFFLVAGRM
ncbi:MAG: cyclic nucleotide-binding domain-containing protein [Saprospiraceae bacterium]